MGGIKAGNPGPDLLNRDPLTLKSDPETSNLIADP
jgi:hypothetical protein